MFIIEDTVSSHICWINAINVFPFRNILILVRKVLIHMLTCEYTNVQTWQTCKHTHMQTSQHDILCQHANMLFIEKTSCSKCSLKHKISYLSSSYKKFGTFSVSSTVTRCNEICYPTRLEKRFLLHSAVKFLNKWQYFDHSKTNNCCFCISAKSERKSASSYEL